MSASLTIRRVAGSLALAIVITCVVAVINGDAALLTFVPLWIGLFIGWPFISRKLDFHFQKSSTHSPAPRLNFNRLVITGLLAAVCSAMLSVILDIGPGIQIIPLWLVLCFGFHYLGRWLPSRNAEKTPAAPATPAPTRPLWLRFTRGTLASAFGIMLVFLIVFSPASLSFVKARKARDAVHIGMTVPEVLQATKNCELFRASSDFPYDQKADRDNIPEMSLRRGEDGTYQTYDPPTRQNLQLSESQLTEYLHARLHDGYPWKFTYTYTNITPQHVSFSVLFGADGRVAEVKPIYGWD